VSPLGWTRFFFSNPNHNKPALNLAVAHGPQNLTAGLLNEVFYKIWRQSVYGDLRNKVRIKMQIHDSIFYVYRGEGTPELVRQLMVNPLMVKDIKGVERKLVIPVDMSYGKRSWAELK
jgi:hypothetical protein